MINLAYLFLNSTTNDLFTSYSHYIVPELGPDVNFCYASHKAVNEYKEAKAVSLRPNL